MATIGGQYKATLQTYNDKDIVEVLPTDVNGKLLINSLSVNTYVGSIIVTTPASAGTLASPINGLTKRITVVTPDLSGTATGTATLKLIDGSGGTIIALAAQPESGTVSYGTQEPITTDMSWIATCEGTQSATGTILLRVHYEK